MPARLPPKPDFEAIEAAAIGSADHRAMVLALIGNLVFSWSNNESMFIYVLMILLETDEVSAAIVFATLNTTRARLDLVQRLTRAKVNDREVARRLDRLIERFNTCTRIRNELNHCMYAVSERGEITHTHAMKIRESAGRLVLGEVRPVDEARIRELTQTIGDLKELNRALWDFLPGLQAAVGAPRPAARPVDVPDASLASACTMPPWSGTSRPSRTPAPARRPARPHDDVKPIAEWFKVGLAYVP